MEPSVPSPSPVPQRRLTWWAKWAVFGIAAGVALGFTLGLGVPAVQNALRQPKMSLTDLAESNTPCKVGFNGPYAPQYESFTFSIYNTGDAAGFATVSILVGENGQGQPFPTPVTFAQNRFFVPASSGAAKDATVQVNDCYTTHTWNVIISAVDKA